jgi:hypothetical protein
MPLLTHASVVGTYEWVKGVVIVSLQLQNNNKFYMHRDDTKLREGTWSLCIFPSKNTICLSYIDEMGLKTEQHIVFRLYSRHLAVYHNNKLVNQLHKL